MAFLADGDFLLLEKNTLEKNTGKVQRVTDGAPVTTVLELAVNSASERGLLGIALHPDCVPSSRTPASPLAATTTAA